MMGVMYVEVRPDRKLPVNKKEKKRNGQQYNNPFVFVMIKVYFKTKYRTSE